MPSTCKATENEQITFQAEKGTKCTKDPINSMNQAERRHPQVTNQVSYTFAQGRLFSITCQREGRQEYLNYSNHFDYLRMDFSLQRACIAMMKLWQISVHVFWYYSIIYWMHREPQYKFSKHHPSESSALCRVLHSRQQYVLLRHFKVIGFSVNL